jgi:hypothetical protein
MHSAALFGDVGDVDAKRRFQRARASARASPLLDRTRSVAGPARPGRGSSCRSPAIRGLSLSKPGGPTAYGNLGIWRHLSRPTAHHGHPEPRGIDAKWTGRNETLPAHGRRSRPKNDPPPELTPRGQGIEILTNRAPLAPGVSRQAREAVANLGDPVLRVTRSPVNPPIRDRSRLGSGASGGNAPPRSRRRSCSGRAVVRDRDPTGSKFAPLRANTAYGEAIFAGGVRSPR